MADDDSSSSTSPEQADLGDLAKQYVDLWQQQLSGAASNEALAGVMAQTVQLMNAGAAAMAAQTSSMAGANNPKEPMDESGTTGTTTASPSPGTGDPTIHELHRRIEQLEERIAALESGSGDKG